MDNFITYKRKLKKFLYNYDDLGVNIQKLNALNTMLKDDSEELNQSLDKYLTDILYIEYPTCVNPEWNRIYPQIKSGFYAVDVEFTRNHLINRLNNYDGFLLDKRFDEENYYKDNALLFDYNRLKIDYFIKTINKELGNDKDVIFFKNKLTEDEVTSTFSRVDNFFIPISVLLHQGKSIKQEKIRDFKFLRGLPSSIIIQDYCLQKRIENFDFILSFFRYDDIIAAVGNHDEIDSFKLFLSTNEDDIYFVLENFRNNYIKLLDSINNHSLEKFLSSFSEQELLDLMPFWNKIYDYYDAFSSTNHFYELIQDLFIKYDRTLNDFNCKKIELKHSNQMFEPFYNNKFENIVENIKNYSEDNYFIDEVPIEFIYLYFSEKGITEDFLQKSYELFEKINHFKYKNDLQLTLKSITDLDVIKTSDKKANEVSYSKAYIFETLIKLTYNKRKIAVANIKMPLDKLIMCEKEEKFISRGSYDINDLCKMVKEACFYGANYIIFPEFCIPYNEINRLVMCCKKYNISLITGIMHLFIKNTNEAINYTLVYDNDISLPLLKAKNYYPYEELGELGKLGKIPKIFDPCYIIYKSSKFVYSTMTCYEATNIRDRGFLNNRINCLFMPVYNQDTTYFSNIVSSTSRDLSCYIAQANNSEYGDSRITQPSHSYNSEIVQAKGGDNLYFVVGTVDIGDLITAHNNLDKLVKTINKQALINTSTARDIIENEIKKFKDNKKLLKPLSAGSSTKQRRKNGVD